MASRLGLARIVEWAKNADIEELAYVLGRIGKIAQERARQVKQADQHSQTKRVRRTKAQIAADEKQGHPADVAARGEAIGA